MATLGAGVAAALGVGAPQVECDKDNVPKWPVFCQRDTVHLFFFLRFEGLQGTIQVRQVLYC